jgi:Ca2+-transporting ATPase
MPAEAVLSQLDSSRDGLTSAEASRRLAEHGPNELEHTNAISPWSILADQVRNALVIILLVATAVSAVLGQALEALAIAVIVLFAIVLGFVQEYRAERAMAALRQMAAPLSTAMRDGREVELAVRELVPGDVIIVHAGDKIPADARLLELSNLKVEESALTGESVPVEKRVEPLAKPELGLGDRTNMIYAGTAAAYGRGRAVVVATGMSTEFGNIAEMLQSVETSGTPLQENLDRVGRVLTRIAIAIVVLIVGLGISRGQPFVELLLFGVALAVAVVPEALTAVVTISLALGVKRMSRRNVLVRRLPAVETLGSTSVICSDKTGTMTRDEMTVRRVSLPGAPGETWELSGAGYEPRGEFSRDGSAAEPSVLVKELLSAAALASDAHLLAGEGEGGWSIQGDPTEGALVVAAAKAGLRKDDLDVRFPRCDEIPFSSEAQRMTTLHATPDGVVAYAKGAPEALLDACTRQRTDTGETPLRLGDREAVLDAARRMGDDALRVLAVARKANATRETAEREMTFLGLVGMIDPPRQEARAAVQICEQAGIKVVMITGDHPVTAQAVARELGVLREGRAITGAELEELDDEELEREVEDIEVYARVSPQHKLRVVTALQKRGHVTAMTGDGVNDAPTLKRADIGIAMGITGTDVTKEAAAMTLTDDNFASIVAAVEEGRGVFSNIKKYLMYLLSSNIGEVGLIAGTSLLGMPLPLTAVQILYVNLATDGFPALALSVDPPEADLMRRPPRDARTGIFTRPVVFLTTVGGLWSAAVNLGIFAWALESGRSLTEAMTMTFAALVLIQFFKAYNFRSDRHSVLRRPFANRWLNLAILWECLLLALIVYLPALQGPFSTYGMPLSDWLVILPLAFSVSLVLEVAKWMVRRGWLGQTD